VPCHGRKHVDPGGLGLIPTPTHGVCCGACYWTTPNAHEPWPPAFDSDRQDQLEHDVSLQSYHRVSQRHGSHVAVAVNRIRQVAQEDVELISRP
jgi:hypothetical protein